MLGTMKIMVEEEFFTVNHGKIYNFWHDMKKGYEKDKSLERIDNERGYFPQNCKWAFVEEQNNNKRNSVKLTFKGLTLTVTEWAKRMDLPRGMIYAQVNRGWSDEKILGRN